MEIVSRRRKGKKVYDEWRPSDVGHLHVLRTGEAKKGKTCFSAGIGAAWGLYLEDVRNKGCMVKRRPSDVGHLHVLG